MELIDKLCQFLTISVVLELRDQLPCQVLFLLTLCDLITYGTIDLEDEGDDNIQHNQGANDPKRGEVESWPI